MLLRNLTFIFVSVVISLTACAKQTTTISQQELLSLMAKSNNQDFIVLDVRTAEEFNNGHIDGAINISHDEVEDKLAQLSAYKDKLVVVHCRSGRRAQSAENDLLTGGFKKLRHLEGDMQGWRAAKLPLIQGH